MAQNPFADMVRSDPPWLTKIELSSNNISYHKATFYSSEDDVQYAVFHKQPNGGSGIEIAGGNATGVFVCNVLCGGNAQDNGVREGDQILKVKYYPDSWSVWD